MTPKPTLQALASDVLALQATVRAVARVQARRSPGALSELVQALCEETGKLGEALSSFDVEGRERVATAGGAVAALIADLNDEAAKAA